MTSKCVHSNQRKFPAEINIHFPGGIKMLDVPSVWVFPHLSVCMDCGFTQFLVNDEQLRRLSDGNGRTRSQTMAA